MLETHTATPNPHATAPATNTPAIRTWNLAKTYTPDDAPPIQALEDINLNIAAGEIYALLGPNGAGKTTLISILTTLLLPSQGRAEVAGDDVVGAPAAVRRRIGVTFQETVLDLQLTGRQCLQFHGRLYGLDKATIAARAQELADLVELSDALDRKVAGYSGGMKRRLELIRGLLTRPQLLFLDEPTQGLDPQNRLAIWRYLGDLRQEQQLTILLTTHYMEEAETLADRVGIIDRGRLVLEGDPHALSAELGQDMIALTGSGDVATLQQSLAAAPWVENLTLHKLDAAKPSAPTKAITEPRVTESGGTESGGTEPQGTEPQGTESGGVFQIGVANGGQKLAQVVEMASAAGFQIHDLTIKRPTLADVFLAATGTNLPRE